MQIRTAWELKEEQLTALKTILIHEKYNTTGLAKNETMDDCIKSLQHYIDEAEATHTKEGEILTEDERLLGIKLQWWQTQPCPCVWGPWGEWSDCSKTCTEEGDSSGTQFRERIVEQAAINDGEKCDGTAGENSNCNDKCCRKLNFYLIFKSNYN